MAIPWVRSGLAGLVPQGNRLGSVGELLMVVKSLHGAAETRRMTFR